METLCIAHFTLGSCPNLDCPAAHCLSALANPKNWVFFHAPQLVMLDFLPYKYQSHHYFQTIFLPGLGPIVRFATAEEARTVVQEFREYYTPAHLPDVLAELEPKQASAHVVASPEVQALERLCQRELRRLRAKANGQQPLEQSPSPRRLAHCNSNSSLRGSGCFTPNSFSSDDLSSECLSSPPVSPLDCHGLHASCSPPSPHSHSGASTPSSHDKQRPDRSAGILTVLREHTAKGAGFVGWTALRQLWGIAPQCLDEAALTYLARKTPAEQEQILLSFAAIDLSHIQNLSAYLNCLIREHETTSQVCIHFLAGLCPHGDNCRYIHPVNTAGWELLQTRWGMTYRDLDYAVLNYLSKKPVPQQDEILTLFADMNLKAVKNRSAYLSSMIERYERVGLRKRTRTRGKGAKVGGKGE